MANVENLFIRNGTYYARKRVPECMIEILGKRELKKSLRTKDQNVALKIFPGVLLEIEAEIERCQDKKLQSSQTEPTLAISSNDIERIYLEKFKATQTAELDMRESVFKFLDTDQKMSVLWEIHPRPKPEYEPYLNKVNSDGDVSKIARFLKEVRNEHRIAELEEKLAIGDIEDLKADARKFVKGSGIDESSIHTIIRTLVKAEINALTELEIGEDATTGEPALVSKVNGDVIHKSNDALSVGPLLSLCVADWIAEKVETGSWTEKSANERRSALDAFSEICGDRFIGSYSKADGREYKKTIQLLPPNFQKKIAFKGMGLKAIARNAKKENLPKPTNETINKKLANVFSFFSWLESHYDEAPKNPIGGLKLSTVKHARDQRNPFTIEELNRLFKFTVWTGCKSRTNWAKPGEVVLRDSAIFWVPLIALFSGMRLSEITLLDCDDVKYIGGVQCFSVHESETRRVKTRSSIRDIPVHQTLLDIGFEKFLALRKKSDTRLFPDIEMGPSDNPASPASKRFIRLLKAAGIKTDKNAFHSFRHNFEDGCLNSDIPVDITNALQGHTAKGMVGRYGNGYMSGTLNKELQKLHYDGLDLNHLIGDVNKSSAT